MIAFARVISVVLKVAALACAALAVALMGNATSAQTLRSIGAEVYAGYLVMVVFIPAATGAFLLTASLILDVWIIGRLNRLLMERIAARVGEWDV